MSDVPIPEHLQRHKEAFDRYMAGDAYTEIARDFDVTPTRVHQMAKRWMQHVNRYNRKEKYGVVRKR